MSKGRHTPWIESELALLGTARDGAIARQVGRSQTAVRLKRATLGIPPAVKRGRPPISANANRMQMQCDYKCNPSALTGL